MEEGAVKVAVHSLDVRLKSTGGMKIEANHLIQLGLYPMEIFRIILMLSTKYRIFFTF